MRPYQLDDLFLQVVICNNYNIMQPDRFMCICVCTYTHNDPPCKLRLTDLGTQPNQNDTVLSMLLNTAFRYNIVIQFQPVVNSNMAGRY